MVEDIKHAPLIAAIQTTLLVVPWAITTSLVWAYQHSAPTLCLLFPMVMQCVFIAVVMAINFHNHVSVVMPVDEKREKKILEKKLAENQGSILSAINNAARLENNCISSISQSQAIKFSLLRLL